MVDVALAPLPKGRHSLTRAQVEQAQRIRLAVAMADAMAERGYVGTPVAAVLERAGVSRETFYRLYDDKLAFAALPVEHSALQSCGDGGPHSAKYSATDRR